MKPRNSGLDPVSGLIEDSLSGRLSRRDIARRGAALGLAAPLLAAMGRFASDAAAQDATPAAAAPTGEPIRLGAVFGLTGGMASIDVPGSRGALLAADEINANGGILGRPVELVLEDGRTDVTATTNATRKLIDESQVAALLGVNDTTYALAVAPIAQEAGRVFLTTGATGPIIPDVGDFIFMLPFGDNVQAAAGAEYAKGEGWTTCGLLTDDQLDFTLFLSDFFKQRFEDDDINGKIVSEQTFASGDTDFSAQMTEFAALDPQPDFWYFSAAPNEAGTTVRQARDAGLNQPILSGDGFDTPLLVELGGDAANGVVFATHQGVYEETPAVTAFRAAYEKQFDTQPETVFAALGYDGVRLLADAIERAGSDDPTAIRDALAATHDFAGVTGAVSYEEGSRIPTKGVALVEIVDGQYTFLRNVTPERVPPAS
ncbi:MAG: ABC transporter substrate-binding protein [Thermomicrobiales bacterium]|nr:ABC transporter substrate-binding protein [Thermomicrobiales bacterium]